MSGLMRFNRLGSDEGLPSLGVFAIAQDSDGLMWFGTRAGLARYDGRRVRTYVSDPRVPGSLPGNDVTALAVDRSGGLWVGTEGGLRKYDRDTDTFVKVGADTGQKDAKKDAEKEAESPAARPISTLFVDSRNRLWIGFATGVGLMDVKTGAFQLVDGFAESGLAGAAEQSDGKLLFCLRGEGVSVYDPVKRQEMGVWHDQPGSLYKMPSTDVTSVLVDARGRIWIGTGDAGVVLIENGKLTSFRHDGRNLSSLADDGINVIASGPRGTVWVGTERGGLHRYNEKGGFIRHPGAATEPDRLSGSFVGSAHMSRDGVMWIGTLSDGVSYFDALSLDLTHYTTRTIAITAITEDAQDPKYLWFGPEPEEAGGLYRVNRETGEYSIYKALPSPQGDLIELQQVWITSVHSDAKGTLWFGTHVKGLIEYRRGENIAIQHKVAREDDWGTVQSILANPDGSFWLGTWGEGLVYFNPATRKLEHNVVSASDPGSVTSDYIYSVVRDRQDPSILWVGTAQGGLDRFDARTRKVTPFQHDPLDATTIANDNVLTSYQDKAGRTWIGTYGGGLNQLDVETGRFTRYSGGNFPATVYGILEDSKGRLWIPSTGGLRVFDPATGIVTSYVGRDGLQSDDFGQGGAYRGASGTFFFGGVNGVTALDPEKVQPDTFAPPALLTGFTVFGEPRPVGRQVELSYRDSVIAFHFAAPAYADPRRVQFEYQLQGLHDRWIATDQPSVTYTNIGRGDYVFRVRAKGRHGAVGKALEIPVLVEPPPWLTWWAYAVYGVAGVLAIVGLFAYQRRKVRLLQQHHRLEAVERDLALTGAVQAGFLPEEEVVTADRFGLVGVLRAADKCSGDWWWHEQVSGTRHLIAVGDVTGHGPGPAMVTAAVSTTFRVARDGWQAGPLEFLQVANDQVIKVGRGRYLMHLTMVELDTATGEVTLYGVGGLPAICLMSDKLRAISARGTPLGTPKFEVASASVTISPGDRIMLLTDGIPEIQVDKRLPLGIRNLTRLYQKTSTMPLPEAAGALLSAAQQANGLRAQEDDWTLVIAEWSTARRDPRAISAPPGRQASGSWQAGS
jgi:ligand-binding sensor domain-containing protein